MPENRMNGDEKEEDGGETCDLSSSSSNVYYFKGSHPVFLIKAKDLTWILLVVVMFELSAG